MAIAQIQDDIIVNIEPFVDIPIDNTWLYVQQAKVTFNQTYYSLSEPTYTYDANTNIVQEIITPVPRQLDYLISLRLGELASLRWNQQNAGTTFNGIPILTDDDSETKILGIRISAMANSEYTVNFKSPIGFFNLDANTIFAISDTVRDYIQGCFDNETLHTTNIQALTDPQAVIDYDITTGWPS